MVQNASPSQSPKKCLIVGPSWVGDMIMAQSLFIQLKQDNKDLEIDVLAPAWSEPLLASMPEVSNSIVMPLGHGKLGLRERYRLGKSLRKKQYDWSVVLPNSLKSALVPFWAKIPRRTGYKGEMRYGLLNDIRHLDKQTLTMTVQRFVALGYKLHPPQTPDYPQPKILVSPEQMQKTLAKFALSADSTQYIALCPGAEYGSAKRWPEKHYAEFAKLMIQKGPQVLLLGSGKDQPVAKEISQLTNSSDLIDLTGKTDLNDVIALLKHASAVVSNDSGLMHIAAAVDTPLVALYGSSDPNFTPPLSDKHAIINLNLECSPCFKRECPLGTLACLEGITVEMVEKSIASLTIDSQAKTIEWNKDG